MKTVAKTAVDETARISRKYARTSDVDLLAAETNNAKKISVSAFGCDDYWLQFKGLIDAIVGTRGLKRNASNEELYSVLKIIGYEVKEK